MLIVGREDEDMSRQYSEIFRCCKICSSICTYLYVSKVPTNY